MQFCGILLAVAAVAVVSAVASYGDDDCFGDHEEQGICYDGRHKDARLMCCFDIASSVESGDVLDDVLHYGIDCKPLKYGSWDACQVSHKIACCHDSAADLSDLPICDEFAEGEGPVPTGH